MNSFVEFAKDILQKDHILLQEPLKKYTTFRVGGPAFCMCKIQTVEQLQKIVPYLSSHGLPYFVIGKGSNLLVADAGYEGVVLSLGETFEKTCWEDNTVTAGATVLLGRLAREAMERSLTGLEFAAGIPGTLGGGMKMNAGAYGGELSQLVTKAKVMTAQGTLMELEKDQLELGYRSSIFHKKDWILLEATLQCQLGEQIKIKETMDRYQAARKEKQPLEYGSAGSTFKRPEGNFAGKLIMDAGLRGFRIGDAQVSEKHCGFVINRGNATADEILQVIHEVQKEVQNQFQVALEPEVIMVGKF